MIHRDASTGPRCRIVEEQTWRGLTRGGLNECNTDRTVDGVLDAKRLEAASVATERIGIVG